MVIDYKELKSREFSLSNIKVILQEPSYRSLVQKSRLFNGFLYIIDGGCRYAFDGGEFYAGEGSLIYLPFGSKHTMTAYGERFRFYRVDFTIRIKKEIALFSEIPIKITDNAPPECAEILNELEGDYGTSCSSIARMEKLCRLLSCIEKSETGKISSRLAPAINFLQENATEKINCAHLAELCFLGTSRFYELFKRELGATPLEYRDDLLIRRAASMLEAGDVSVKEAALAAGFENTAYFSRFFKKHTGLSPTEYTKNHTYKL